MKQTLLSISVLIICVIGCSSSVANASDHAALIAPGMADGAPPELMHWGKMVGRWSTTEESLSPNTGEWVPSEGADWDFHWAFNGWGIADNYTSPPLSEPLDYEAARQRGINLRIYNPVDKKWVLTWLTVGASKALTMTAVSSDDEIIMLSDEANAQGRYSRITFFDMTEDTFEWKLEWSNDQNLWVEVYRIHGTRRKDDVAEAVVAAGDWVNDAEKAEVDIYEPEVSEADISDSAEQLSETVESEMTNADADESEQ